MLDLAHVNWQKLGELVVHWGTSGLWAAVILLGGWMVANWAERGVSGALSRVPRCDQMLRGFFANLIRWAILVFTGIAVLERLGVQTTSMVAILGATGLAIGLALQGTLANLAAGVMLLLFRPFRVGDGIEAGGLSGTVREVTLFHTHLVTGENVQVIAPNSLLWTAAVRNLSFNPTRKIEIVVPVPYDDLDASLDTLRRILQDDPRVVDTPAPAVTVVKLGEKTIDVAMSAWCTNGDVATLKGDLAAAAWRQCLKGRMPVV
ncbi:MAG: mechanosensitive ion channel family protein [Solirubrobacterales bacterium]